MLNLKNLFIISIALIIPYILYQGYDLLTGRAKFDNCFTFGLGSGKNEECVDYRNKIEQTEQTKFICLTVIAIIMLVLGFLGLSKNSSWLSTCLGVICGSILLILAELYLNWNRVSRGSKVIMSGIALVVIIFFSQYKDFRSVISSNFGN
jgi:TRAP-type mannitol/chloroaromatic compound transport system permease large subunit